MDKWLFVGRSFTLFYFPSVLAFPFVELTNLMTGYVAMSFDLEIN